MNDESSPPSAASCRVGWCESLTQQASNHFFFVSTNKSHVNMSSMLDKYQSEMPCKVAQAGRGLMGEVTSPHLSLVLSVCIPHVNSWIKKKTQALTAVFF